MRPGTKVIVLGVEPRLDYLGTVRRIPRAWAMPGRVCVSRDTAPGLPKLGGLMVPLSMVRPATVAPELIEEVRRV